MLGLPLQTEVNMLLPKKELLSRMVCTSSQKNRFNCDIQSIKITNEISTRYVSIGEGKNIKAIFVVEVILKTSEPSLHTIELLFDLMKRNIVFVLHYGESERLVVKNKKIFFNDWSNSGYSLSIEGLTLDDVWAGFVSRIGNIAIRDGEMLDAAVDRKVRNDEILRQIEILNKKKAKIKTKAMQFDIHNEIVRLKKELEE